ncbi:MAG: hypothetical protein IJX30_03170 [Clostridia bacterium]|nr:hypothetical protein [Clostridia bacterium]
MAIKTTAGNTVKFLGLTQSLRESLLKAILGGSSDGKVTVNTPKVCYVGLSSTNPETAVTEPTDANYKRIKIGETGGSAGTVKSDYLTITGTTAVNSGVQKEIKFNRSLGAWTGTYPYFFLSSSETGNTGLMAWGEMTEPITVSAKNVVPLFEEDKFRLYFPAPSEVETLVDAAAAADEV